VDQGVEALFDLSLDLVGRDVLGPSSRHPRAAQAWRELFPKLAAPLAAEPARVAGSLNNAACNLGQEPGARPLQWLREMAEVGPRCAGADELLALGQVLAWRSGMAHLRDSAVAVWEKLPEPLARASLGLPADGAEPSRERLRRDLDDPFRPPGAPGGPPRLEVVAAVGGFRGLGGPFVTPPRAFALCGHVWAADAERAFTVHADCFGQTLQRAPRVPADDRLMGEASVEGDGQVSFAGLTQRLPELAGAGGFAAAGHLLAVTLPRSHRLRLVARLGGAP
jgi:hypothetical protein